MASALKKTMPLLLLLVIAALAVSPAVALAGELSEWIDGALPAGLSLLGIVVGCPALVIIGRIWGRAKPAGLVEELVRAVQSARQRIMSSGAKTALKSLDNKLSRAMSAETKQAIKAVKRKLELKSAKEYTDSRGERWSQ